MNSKNRKKKLHKEKVRGRKGIVFNLDHGKSKITNNPNLKKDDVESFLKETLK